MARVEPAEHGNRGGRYLPEEIFVAVVVTGLRVRVGPLAECHRIETVVVEVDDVPSCDRNVYIALRLIDYHDDYKSDVVNYKSDDGTVVASDGSSGGGGVAPRKGGDDQGRGGGGRRGGSAPGCAAGGTPAARSRWARAAPPKFR